jgi:hypothetical protein
MDPAWRVALSATVLLAGAAAATAADLLPGRQGLYALVSAGTGKCLDVEGADLADGARVLLWDCLNLPHQAWALRAMPSGGFQLVAQHSGRCLSAAGQDSSLRQRGCKDASDQIWLLREEENGRVRLELRSRAACAGVADGQFPASLPVASGTCRRDLTGEWSLASVHLSAARVFPLELPAEAPLASDIEASPLYYAGDDSIIVASTDGTVASHDPSTGGIRWSVPLPRPDRREAYVWATPIIVGDRLIAAYESLASGGTYRGQHVAVVDLRARAVDSAFPYLNVSTEHPIADGSGTVRFQPDTQVPHAALVHLPGSSGSGRIYVGYGGRSDTQPWHGWLFEIDLDSWHRAGPDHAIAAALVTTPETECPVEGKSGAQAMVCGGGIWSPAGPLVVPGARGPELIVATGNGQLDLARRDYAQTLMRVPPGLAFEPDCDAQLCARFDPVRPDEGCMRSCRNLFIPRLLPGDRPLRPASGECGSRSFWECLAWHDYDLGAGSPLRVELDDGPAVLVQPGKEGGVYLIDAEHLGTLYDREQVVPLCGSENDPCAMDWAGMMVTQPSLAHVNGRPLVLLATFVPDQTHPAGLVALRIDVQEGRPAFEFLWRAPAPGSRQATRRFRYWPSRVAVAEGQAWLVDYHPGEYGTLLGVRLADGEVTAEMPLLGQGQRHALPLVRGDMLYLPSTAADGGGAWLEAYRVRPAPEVAMMPGGAG